MNIFLGNYYLVLISLQMIKKNTVSIIDMCYSKYQYSVYYIPKISSN